MIRLAPLAATFLLLVGAVPPVLADGGFVPETAYAALPAIPAQRALIVYKDGVETLTVESTFDTPSPDVGWILPVPAAPTKVEVADSGTLTSLAVFTGPDIVHDLSGLCWYAIYILPFLGVIVLIAIVGRRWPTPVELVMMMVYGAILVGLFLPAMGSAGGGSSATPSVLTVSTEKVGNYEVSVLRAADGKALDAWLAEHGLKDLGSEGRAVADDYAARGWCFAVARLSRDAGGTATPHPLSVTFPAAQPVYPMKLTRVAGSTTHVELYVVADRQAAADGFHLAFADQFADLSVAYHGRLAEFISRHGEPLRYLAGDAGESADPRDPTRVFEGRRFGTAIGTPSLVAVLWEGCIVTRLEADLAPADMDRDVDLRWADLRPHRDTFYSRQGRRHAVAGVLLWGAVPILLLVAVFYGRPQRPGRKALRALAILISAVLVMALVAALWYPAVAVGPSWSRWQDRTQPRLFEIVARCMVSQDRLHAGMTDRQIEETLRSAPDLGLIDRAEAAGWTINPYTGSPERFERSPGNFATRQADGQTWLCYYDRNGVEERLTILTPPQSRRP
jgi:hypothetical protein